MPNKFDRILWATNILDTLSILQAINDDISSQKAKAREFITKGKKLLRESSFEDDPQLRERVEHLKQKVDAVGKLGVDRLSQLEQTLPLAKAFYDTHQDLITWFAEVNPTLAELDVMSIDADHVKRQQDQVKVWTILILCNIKKVQTYLVNTYVLDIKVTCIVLKIINEWKSNNISTSTLLIAKTL